MCNYEWANINEIFAKDVPLRELQVLQKFFHIVRIVIIFKVIDDKIILFLKYISSRIHLWDLTYFP